MVSGKMLINGVLVDGASQLDVVNPATGQPFATVARADEAEAALAQMNQRGLRSAKVMLERPELPSLWLRLPAADASVRTRLEALMPQLAGKAVQVCT